jgi:hypothetical protein
MAFHVQPQLAGDFKKNLCNKKIGRLQHLTYRDNSTVVSGNSATGSLQAATLLRSTIALGGKDDRRPTRLG